jgi:hypothetical protein
MFSFTPFTASRQAPTFYAELVHELDALGWDHLTSIDADLTLLEFKATDHADRMHKFRAEIPPGYPNLPPIITTSTVHSISTGFSTRGMLLGFTMLCGVSMYGG